MNERFVGNHYRDPLDIIWLQAAGELGLSVERSDETFASYDGQGVLTICTPEHFDADDCLAQMIFHELCHWLVAGLNGKYQEDWGLSNVDDRDLVYEYAAIRLQAELAGAYGLRAFMAVTTDWRPYWDSLPDNPLYGPHDPAVPLAIEGKHLSQRSPFAPVLDRALAATSVIAEAVRSFANQQSLFSLTEQRHRLGGSESNDPNLRCGDCAWADRRGSLLNCLQHFDGITRVEVHGDERACERWESKLTIDQCGQCGACCREGFDVLGIDHDDPFKNRFPDLVELRPDGETCVPRPNGRCVALDVKHDEDDKPLYRCRHYENRPKNCQQFEVAGEACLLARRRIGLSR